MRKDMKQVIIERPRHGRIKTKPTRPNHSNLVDGYDGPLRESTRKYYKSKGINKVQSDILTPLKGFLDKNVGRPWDLIWSEVCEHNKDYMGDHLKRHLLDFVALHPVIGKDGKVRELDGTYFWFTHYVQDGILKKIQEKRSKYRCFSLEQKLFELDGQTYLRFEEIWYRVELQKIPDYIRNDRLCCSSIYDVFGNKIKSPNLFSITIFYGKSGVYAVWKQQANSRECEKLRKTFRKVS